MILEFLQKLSPILFCLTGALLLKLKKIFDEKDAQVLLKLVYYFTLPAISFVTISKIKLTREYVYFPLVVAGVIASCYFIARYLSSKRNFSSATQGSYVIATILINTSFAFPFLQILLGKDALVSYLIFDFFNAIFIYSIGYLIACSYGSKNTHDSFLVSKVLCSPPLWSVLFGILCSSFSVEIPGFVLHSLETVGLTTSPLLLVSLGFSFSWSMFNKLYVYEVVLIRMLIGGLIAFLFTLFFEFTAVNKLIIIVCSSAPCGFNTLVFANLEELDSKLAASVVSLSMLISLILCPILIFIFS